MTREDLLDLAVGALTLATAGFAVAAVARPESLSGEPATAGQQYYARMYAARAVPLAAGAPAVVAAGATSRGTPWAGTVLGVAAAAQVADAVIGVTDRQPRQIVPPLIGAAAYAARARARRTVAFPA